MEAAEARVALICMDIQIELLDAVIRSSAGAALDQLEVVIGHGVTALVDHAHHELLPLVDFRAGALRFFVASSIHCVKVGALET